VRTPCSTASIDTFYWRENRSNFCKDLRTVRTGYGDSGGNITMTLGFQKGKSVLSKRKRKESRIGTSIQSGQIIDATLLPRGPKRSHLLHGGSMSTIAVPGGRTLIMRKGSAIPVKEEVKSEIDACPPSEIDANHSPSDDFTPFISPILLHEFDSKGIRQKKRREQAHQARRRLATQWTDNVLPRILPIYLKYQALKPMGGRDVDPHNLPPQPCTCGKLKLLPIIVVYWNCTWYQSLFSYLLIFSQHSVR
jgi:hypothetical protein